MGTRRQSVRVVAVAPDGTVYAAFMRAKDGQSYPVVAASFDHGQTIPQVTSLVPPNAKDWGGRAGASTSSIRATRSRTPRPIR